MATYNARLLTPPPEEEEIYPYRRAWRSIILEHAVIFGGAALLFVAVNFLRLTIPGQIAGTLNLLLALLPTLLWLIFSWWPERSVPQPRERLVMVFIMSALAANAVGVPLMSHFFLENRWLSLSSAVDRIVGYTFTVGIVQELIKYLVIRYLVWPDHLRNRYDAVAYAATASTGYVLVMSLHFIGEGSPAPDVVAARVFSITAVHLAASVIVSYGLAESRFSDPNLLLLPLTFAAAALLTGIATPVRSGFINANIGVNIVTAPRPLFGLGFSLAMLVGVLFSMAFLYNNAEQQARELSDG